MLAQGTPLHVVSEILGHTSIATTKDVMGTCSSTTSGRLRR
jgi:integrase